MQKQSVKQWLPETGEDSKQDVCVEIGQGAQNYTRIGGISSGASAQQGDYS